MQKISPFLWFEKDGRQVANFYTSIFPESKLADVRILHDTPSGTVEIVNIELLGENLTLMSAGPLFKFTPAISFLVGCNSAQEVDALWQKLSEGGSVLMPLDKYPFSERYGWLQDRYGLSWQIMYMADRTVRQRIVPTLMFVGKRAGKAEEAIGFYQSVFEGSQIDHIMRYSKEDAPDQEGTIKHAGFSLQGYQFAAMDSAREHNFSFNESISFVVNCETQQEIDYYWAKMSAEPDAEACGWLKDPYGVSWQIVPTILDQMWNDKNPQKVASVTQALLKMKKLNIEELKQAYSQQS